MSTTAMRVAASLLTGALVYIILHIGLGVPFGWTLVACSCVGFLQGVKEDTP